MTTTTEPGAYGIEQVDSTERGALTCGSCGRSWLTDITPAARCPWEHLHDDEDDDADTAHFNVYALCDGAVDAEESFATLDAAAEHYATLISQYTELSVTGQLTADVTVHLYFPAWGVMQAERHVPSSEHRS